MARRGNELAVGKYDMNGVCFTDLLGDPQSLTISEFKRRVNNLLGYKKYEKEEGDDDKELIFYTVERVSRVVRKTGKRRWENIRHYDDSVLDPYVDAYKEISRTIGKLDINEMDDRGCENLAAAVLEEVFKDYKYAYEKSKSQVKETRKAAEAEMEWAVYRMEHGIGSTLSCLPPTEDICEGLRSQVDNKRRSWT